MPRIAASVCLTGPCKSHPQFDVRVRSAAQVLSLADRVLIRVAVDQIDVKGTGRSEHTLALSASTRGTAGEVVRPEIGFGVQNRRTGCRKAAPIGAGNRPLEWLPSRHSRTRRTLAGAAGGAGRIATLAREHQAASNGSPRSFVSRVARKPRRDRRKPFRRKAGEPQEQGTRQGVEAAPP